MIQEHIHKLLFEHDCVIIPDFGGLITHYEPARIHPVKHAFLPPSKRVAFNEKLKLNDGLLISTFAYEKKITAEEAHQQVGAFVRQLQEELHRTQRFELRGIGLFRLNPEQKIEFEYLAASNFLDDSFGLPELITRPVLPADATAGLRTLLREQQVERAVATSKPTLRRRLRRIYDTTAVMAIVGLTGSALYFISLQTEYSLSTLNPFALFGQPAKVEHINRTPEKAAPATEAFVATPPPVETTAPAATPVSTPAPVTPVATEKSSAEAVPVTTAEIRIEKKAPAPAKAPAKVVAAAPADTKNSAAATISAGTNRYHIIAGGYSSLKNAQWRLKQLTRQQGTGKVILPTAAGELHRVSVRDYASKEEALQNLPELKKQYGNNIWILNY